MAIGTHTTPVASLPRRMSAWDEVFCLDKITQFPHQETPSLSLFQQPLHEVLP